MEEWRRREHALLAVDSRGLTHRPQAFRNAVTTNPGLVSRLHLSGQLPASGALFATSWNSDATHLLSAGEDCRLRIWRGDGSDLLHTVDTVSRLPAQPAARPPVRRVPSSWPDILDLVLLPWCLLQGHTSSILAAQFLQNTPDQVICGSADKQVCRELSYDLAAHSAAACSTSSKWPVPPMRSSMSCFKNASPSREEVGSSQSTISAESGSKRGRCARQSCCLMLPVPVVRRFATSISAAAAPGRMCFTRAA